MNHQGVFVGVAAWLGEMTNAEAGMLSQPRGKGRPAAGPFNPHLNMTQNQSFLPISM